jgi:hypothetical protein
VGVDKTCVMLCGAEGLRAEIDGGEVSVRGQIKDHPALKMRG